MLIEGLGRTVHADREREIEERMRQRGLLQDALEAIATGSLQAAPTEQREVETTSTRPAGRRTLGLPARGRTR